MPKQTISIERIIDKLNVLYEEEMLEEALRLIKYWINEASAVQDLRTEYTLTNELMGTCRKLGMADDAFAAASRAVQLAETLGIKETVSYATTLLNCGTVCKAFGRPKDALDYYKKCEELYSGILEEGNELYGGLYNNMATVYVELGEPGTALSLLQKSLKIVEKMEDNERELEAVLLNIEYCRGLESINSDEPTEKLDNISPRFLDISKQFYFEHFKNIIDSEFSDIKQYIAVGLCGSGSECFGFEDDISKDHDFEPGFIIFIPGEDLVSRRQAFQLQRAYDKLPKEYEGLRRNLVDPVGGKRHGVIRTDDFLRDRLGSNKNIEVIDLLSIPSNALAEIINGEIWEDNYGFISKVREVISSMPEDYRLKRLSGELLLMSQSGQYNFERCKKHNEPGAAALALTEFVKATIEVVFLINKSYMPYYKWSFKAMESAILLCDLKPILESMILHASDVKKSDIEGVCDIVAKKLNELGLSDISDNDLGRHAYSVNSKIKDNDIRELNILYGIQ